MRKDFLLLAVFTVLILVNANLAQVLGDPCTGDVDCLCDNLQNDPNVVFCEDYENPAYDDGGATWTQAYSATAVNQCWENSNPCNPPWGPGCRILEGTADGACFNIVQEDACDVAGENDCVFDGSQSLGAKMDAGWEPSARADQ